MAPNQKAEKQHDLLPYKGKIERFIEPCLLLLLAEKPAHGYELIEPLSQFDFEPNVDPGQIYRTLRRMEKHGFVVSNWETGKAGPARRRYQLTAQGEGFLTSWIKTLTKRVQMIEKLLQRYDQVMER